MISARAELLSEALAAFRRGWALTPLRGKCPILDSWQSRRIPSESQVRQWIAWGHNLGLRTGPVSGVLVVDHDPRHDAGTPLPALPVTATVNTGGGGTHRYYRCPADPPPNSTRRIHPALDVKSVGGQVVFVGSLHPDTRRPYAWAPGHSPSDVALVHVPEELLERMREPPAVEVSALPLALPDDERLRRARAYLAKVPGGITGKNGSRPCFRSACVLIHGFGLTPGEAYALLATEYSPRCTPPWSEKELKHKVFDAAKQPGAQGFVLEAQTGTPAWAVRTFAAPTPSRIVLPRRVSAAMVDLLRTGRHEKYARPGGGLDLPRAVFGLSISLLRAGLDRSAAATAIAASALATAIRAQQPGGICWLVRTVERASIALGKDRVSHA